ncbi:MAG: TIGR00725 family protein [Archaeoglobaceae archaeon]|nr:TIGR00725 family protein [Archaeoglobaceae archaeon]MDW7989760.1 TIGR00725 family protein [Archaeoglobaceae archaeon]
MQIGVIGSGVCDEETYRLAYRVGELIAESGCILINGGLYGVMEASAKGAKSRGGITVGILPGNRSDANPYIDIKISTNMGHARNIIIVHSSDALISIAGEYGTISEIAIALREGKPLASLKPPVILKGMNIFEKPEDAIEYILSFRLKNF